MIDSLFAFFQPKLIITDKMKYTCFNFPPIVGSIDVGRKEPKEYTKNYAEEKDLLKKNLTNAEIALN